ncbi:histidine triad nucleotide-binding protein [Nocardioides massiliensis]|uniref:Histidine triad (HIT) family protein n=1 Tax=Nocardioides massiliensis TaxID=1325935 RepID=A0ABT9NRI4_9ACTN|nr:histidine triad nucleotide-binding protein [Nocardioides massiliensis]MDP9822425.1 histidine triad (HIT) family protein [Nocardioides massiliensis]
MTAVSDCLFCKIVAEEIPADVVAADEHTVAFRDISPQAPTHVLVIPREHHVDAASLASSTDGGVDALVRTAKRVAEAEGLGNGYRLVFNTGQDGGQTVFHVHLHLLGGRPMAWPPG